MKLDNRPKKLLVQGATQDQLQSVRDWYEVCDTGNMISRNANAFSDDWPSRDC